MRSATKVSVVLPAYNEERALRGTVSKLQSLPDAFEVLIVNDGSADRMGRFWAGSTQADDQFQPAGSLYRMDANLGVRLAPPRSAIPTLDR